MMLSGTVGFLWHYVFESETVHTIDAIRKVRTLPIFALSLMLFLMYGDDGFLMTFTIYIFTQGVTVDSTSVEVITVSRNMLAYLYEVTLI